MFRWACTLGALLALLLLFKPMHYDVAFERAAGRVMRYQPNPTANFDPNFASPT